MRDQFLTAIGSGVAAAVMVVSGAMSAANAATCARTAHTMLSTGKPATGVNGQSSRDLNGHTSDVCRVRRVVRGPPQ